MKLTEKQKLILALVIFAITGYVIYSSFFANSGSSNTTVTIVDGIAAPSNTTDTTADQDILDLSLKLSAMTINAGIFQSDIFKSLIDFDAALSPEAQGRPNPFDLIGNDVGVVGTFNNVSIPVISATTTKK